MSCKKGSKFKINLPFVGSFISFMSIHFILLFIIFFIVRDSKLCFYHIRYVLCVLCVHYELKIKPSTVTVTAVAGVASAVLVGIVNNLLITIFNGGLQLITTLHYHTQPSSASFGAVCFARN